MSDVLIIADILENATKQKDKNTNQLSTPPSRSTMVTIFIDDLPVIFDVIYI